MLMAVLGPQSPVPKPYLILSRRQGRPEGGNLVCRPLRDTEKIDR